MNFTAGYILTKTNFTPNNVENESRELLPLTGRT